MEQEIIDALSAGAWERATKLWAQNRVNSGQCADACAWGGARKILKCARCLEGRLRTMSLYSHSKEDGEDVFLELSRELNTWCMQQPDRGNV